MKPKLLLTLALLLSAVTGAWAQNPCGDGLTWTLNDGTLTISKTGEGTGAMPDYDLQNVPWYNERNNITSVVIGDGVTAIGKYAFSQYSNLASLTIGSSLQSIGIWAFSGCSKLASVNLPASVTNIGSNAFYNCSNLSSVVIHATSVPTCGNDAFGMYKSGRKIFVPAASVGSYGSGWSAYAADIFGYSNCGETGHESDVIYALTGTSPNYTLYIMKVGATGAMKNCDLENVPWDNERNNITSVVIGDGVTAIGQYAFYNCSNLASLTIGSSLQSIGVCAFYGCSKLASVNLPATMTNIGSNAFDNCSNLSSVVIHATSVPTCGNDAFGMYKSGRKIFVPAASVGSYGSGWSAYAADIIGYNGTCGATGNESDVVYALTGESPNRTLYISGTGAMKDDYKPWSDFTTVIIGDGVTHIGKQSFDYLNFTSLTIGNGVKSIGELAFHNCFGLTSIVIPNSVETIGKKAFEFITTLTSLTIGSGVTSMADNAFDYCENVTSLTISDGVTTIGKGAFEKYSSLTSVVIPSSVTSIGENAFNNCPQLSSVVIQATSVPTCGNDAFAGNKSGRNIFVPFAKVGDYKTGWPAYGSNIFGYRNCGATDHESDVIYALTGTSPNYTLYIMKVGATGAMKNCGDGSDAPWYSERNNITSVVIGDGVTTIGYRAFSHENDHYTNLTSLTIGKDVTTIGEHAFRYCTGLTSVEIPNSVQTIQGHAFEECTGVTSLTIGSSVTSIGDRAFYGLGITSVVIPASVTHIYNSVFNSCSNLSSVVIHPASLTNYGVKVFDNNTSGRKIFVPSGSVSTYTAQWNTTENGNYVADIIDYGGTCGATGNESNVIWALDGESPNCTLYICGTGAMKDYPASDNREWHSSVSSIKSIVIGEDVTSIGKFFFKGCNNLTSVTIPNSVTSIGNEAFYNCSGLTSVTIPNSVTSIGNAAFVGCTGLTSVTIPNSVTTIGESAFDGCSGLTSVTIPASVTTIGQYAFSSSTHLRSVTFYGSPTCSLGENAFNNCDGSLNIYVFSDLESSFESAAGWSSYATIISAITLAANSDGAATPSYWSTYYNPYANAKVTGVQVFKAALNGTNLTLTPISDGIINMGEAVILKSTSASSITLASAPSPSATSYTDNDLKGTTEEMTGAAGNIYVLNKTNENGVGFYRLSPSGTIGVGKAYLTYDGTFDSREFFGFDEATGIVELKNSRIEELKSDDAWYTLDGRKLDGRSAEGRLQGKNPTTKGLYIVNGKKVVIK